MTKSIKTPEQIAIAKAKKAEYDRVRRIKLKAQAAALQAEQARIEQARIEQAEAKKASKNKVLAPAKKVNWKDGIDFSTAVEITRNNVKSYYRRQGYIQVVNAKGDTLHVGKTINMGKVFSNYINCARYKQSYAFNLEGTDRLLFKECTI